MSCATWQVPLHHLAIFGHARNMALIAIAAIKNSPRTGEKRWEASHLCGNDGCHNPAHIIVEWWRVNQVCTVELDRIRTDFICMCLPGPVGLPQWRPACVVPARRPVPSARSCGAGQLALFGVHSCALCFARVLSLARSVFRVRFPSRALALSRGALSRTLSRSRPRFFFAHRTRSDIRVISRVS